MRQNQNDDQAEQSEMLEARPRWPPSIASETNQRQPGLIHSAEAGKEATVAAKAAYMGALK